MKIASPPLQKIEKKQEGYIIKEFVRKQIFDSTFEKISYNKIPFYMIKASGNDVLVSFEKTFPSLLKKYRYVLKQGLSKIKETANSIDLSEFNWLNHPLLEKSFDKKFTNDYDYNSWKYA